MAIFIVATMVVAPPVDGEKPCPAVVGLIINGNTPFCVDDVADTYVNPFAEVVRVALQLQLVLIMIRAYIPLLSGSFLKISWTTFNGMVAVM